jgi:hypothetical protein
LPSGTKFLREPPGGPRSETRKRAAAKPQRSKNNFRPKKVQYIEKKVLSLWLDLDFFNP